MKSTTPIAYAAYYDNDIRMESSSGGIFFVFARHIILNYGVVYGVALTDDCNGAEFRRIVDLEDISILFGSKYIQAKIGDTYNLVKRDLDDGLSVLFTGTVCQVNGLRSFLQKDYDNLFCVDVICHGVPSPLLWRRYVEKKQVEYNCKFKKVSFRCKDIDWENFGMKFFSEDYDDFFVPLDEDLYMQLFLKNYSLRPSCYECVVKKNKLSDLTIADFWGIDSLLPHMNDGKGVSLVLIRNSKGNKLFDEIKEIVENRQVLYEDAISANPSEYKSVKRPQKRDVFFRKFCMYNTLGDKKKLNQIYEKYGRKSKARLLIKRILKKIKLI